MVKTEDEKSEILDEIPKHQLRQNVRGARPGTNAGIKRKDVSELSANPNTKRARARIESMNDAEKELERAKKAESQAIRRGLLKVQSSEAFQKATLQQQSEMLALKKNEVLQIRYVYQCSN